MKATTKRNDKNRRSDAQQAPVMVRVSNNTHKKLRQVAQENRRSLGNQAAYFIEEALKDVG